MPDRRPLVLAVDDDPTARLFIGSLLTASGCLVELAGTAGEFRRKQCSIRPDLYVIDVELPDDDGFTLGNETRAKSDVPIVFFSAHDGDDLRLRAFELGAIEYLTKPVPPREFALRITNMISKLSGLHRSRSLQRRFGGHLLDLAARRLFGSDGKTIALTPAEFDVVVALTANPGHLLSREALASALGPHSAARYNHRIVDVIVWRLRSKLGDDRQQPRFIATHPSRGYSFVMSVEQVE